jgi:hypothetical protein
MSGSRGVGRWCLAALGHANDGVALITTGLADYRAGGMISELPLQRSARYEQLSAKKFVQLSDDRRDQGHGRGLRLR